MIRSPLTRKTPLRPKLKDSSPSVERGEHPIARETKAIKAERCKHCKKALGERERGIHSRCVDGWYEANKEKIAKKAAAKKERAERESFKAREAAIKTIPDLRKEAQREFNAFIRERDRSAGFPCISSGRPLDWSGNGVDAGHYRSVGSAQHLRFDERNCHAQSKHDNQWKSGNAVDYRIGLIQRIGLEAVEALEADNRVHKWTRDELIAIRDKYRKLAKELKAERENESA